MGKVPISPMRFTNAHRTPRKRLLVAGMSLAASAVLLAPAAASADFTLQPCTGSSVAGNGSTLQNTAQQTLWAPAFSADSAGTCSGVSVTYNAGTAITGSGGGRNALGGSNGNRSDAALNPTGTRFAGSDEAPTPTQQNLMSKGDAANAADDSPIHVVPVAATSIAVMVNVPVTCRDAGDIPAEDLDSTGRLAVSSTALVSAFKGGATWGQLILSKGGVPSPDSACAAEPVYRVVRPTDSGSTFALKSFLDKVGSENFNGVGNTVWPGSAQQLHTGGTDAAHKCAVSLCDSSGGTPSLTGGGDLATLVSNSPGAIGYAALPDARGKGFDFQGSTTTDFTYWLQVSSVTNPTPKEATSDVNGWKSSAATGGPGQKGANCNGFQPSNLPGGDDPTLGDWTAVDPTGGTGYPICTFTYDLAFDDNAPVWGTSDAEQAKARSVKDYLTYVVGGVGQSKLGNNVSDYSPLSGSLANIAQKGVAAIGWNKAQGGGTQTDTTPIPPVTTPTTTVVTPPTVTTPIVPAVSNKFTIASSKVKGSVVTVKLTLPGAGKLAVKATTKIKNKTITFSTVSSTVKGGAGTVTLKASKAAISALKKVSSAKVTFKVTFTPNGGAAASQSKSVTVKGTHKAPKKSKKKSSKKK